MVSRHLSTCFVSFFKLSLEISSGLAGTSLAGFALLFLDSYFVSFKYYVHDLLFLFGFVGIESWRAFLVLIIIFSFLVYSVCVVWKRGKKNRVPGGSNPL